MNGYDKPKTYRKRAAHAPAEKARNDHTYRKSCYDKIYGRSGRTCCDLNVSFISISDVQFFEQLFVAEYFLVPYNEHDRNSYQTSAITCCGIDTRIVLSEEENKHKAY